MGLNYIFSENHTLLPFFLSHFALSSHNNAVDGRMQLKCFILAVLRMNVKDINSTVAKRGSVFIGLITSDGAIWSRYQRAVLMR